MPTAGTLVDLLSNDEAKQAIGKGVLDSHQADLLAQFVTAVSEKLVAEVGPIVYGTIIAEAHDGGGNIIYLDKSPVGQITQVVEYDQTAAATLTAETNTTKPDTGYIANLKNGRLLRRASNSDARFAVGRQNVVVTYVAGRYAAGSLVDERYKAAAALILKNAWRAWEISVAQTGQYDLPFASYPKFIMPNAAKEMLADEWRTGSGIGE